jgi:hypothetical protein
VTHVAEPRTQSYNAGAIGHPVGGNVAINTRIASVLQPEHPPNTSQPRNPLNQARRGGRMLARTDRTRLSAEWWRAGPGSILVNTPGLAVTAHTDRPP